MLCAVELRKNSRPHYSVVRCRVMQELQATLQCCALYSYVRTPGYITVLCAVELCKNSRLHYNADALHS